MDGRILGLSWAVLGLFGQSSRPWAVLGPSWGRLGSSWEPPVALFGLSWEPLGALLGHSWLSWGFIWPYWGSPGLSSTPLGQSWGPLGTTLETCAVDVDAVETQKANTLKMYVCSKDIGRFGFLGGPLGGLLGASWKPLKPSGARLKPWLSASGLSWDSLGPFEEDRGRTTQRGR